MSTATITISASTNPTYGGGISFTDPDYARDNLDASNPQVEVNGARVRRVFAFFNLSPADPEDPEDPIVILAASTITKVELLALVNSVSGTHAVDVVGAEINNYGSSDSVAGLIAQPDSTIYGFSAPGVGLTTYITNTPAAGAVAYDLGATAVTDVETAIALMSGLQTGIALSDEAAAGSVVFDAATGFGLRLTYTPLPTGQTGGVMMLGVGK